MPSGNPCDIPEGPPAIFVLYSPLSRYCRYPQARIGKNLRRTFLLEISCSANTAAGIATNVRVEVDEIESLKEDPFPYYPA